MASSSSLHKELLLDPKHLPSVRYLGQGVSGFLYETNYLSEVRVRKDFPLGSDRKNLCVFEKEAKSLFKLKDKLITECIGYTLGKSSCSLVQEYGGSDLHNIIQWRIEKYKKKNSKSSNLPSGVVAAGTVAETTQVLMSRVGNERENMEVDEGISESSPSLLPETAFDIQDALNIISQIAKGMMYLHDQEVVHGDLKPKNVLVCFEGEETEADETEADKTEADETEADETEADEMEADETESDEMESDEMELGDIVVKVTDFGLVETKRRIKLVSKRIRHFEILTWKAPELFSILLSQNSDDPFTDSDSDSVEVQDNGIFLESRLARADVYSFGLTCSHILGGKLIRPDLSLTQLRKQRYGNFRDVVPKLPSAYSKLKAIIRECLEFKPSRRPTFSKICSDLKGLEQSLLQGFSSEQNELNTVQAKVGSEGDLNSSHAGQIGQCSSSAGNEDMEVAIPSIFRENEFELEEEVKKKEGLKLKPTEDMNAPLSHYCIFSIHNSYLTGNQLTSKCSVQPIVDALRSGCRVIELDCWDDQNGKIKVMHGGTLTKAVAFEDCIKAIKMNAFKVSDYPVILIIESHLSLAHQMNAASLLEEILGDIMYIPSARDRSPISFQSPEALKNRIIVSEKPPDKSLPDQVSEDPGAADDVIKANIQWNDSSDSLSDEESSFRARKERKSHSHRSLAGERLAQRVASKRPGDEFLLKVHEFKELLYIYCQKPSEMERQEKGGPLVTGYRAIMANLSESQLDHLVKHHPNSMIEFTKTNMGRMYPLGLRFDSSNADPMDAWKHGLQVAAVNMHGYEQASEAAGQSKWRRDHCALDDVQNTRGGDRKRVRSCDDDDASDSVVRYKGSQLQCSDEETQSLLFSSNSKATPSGSAREYLELLNGSAREYLEFLNGSAREMVGYNRICQRVSNRFVEANGVGASVLGLYGTTGIGKTTVSKALCDYFAGEFMGRVYHVELGATTRMKRQKLMLKTLCGIEEDVLNKLTDDSKGLKLMRDCMNREPVLLVIDNVTHDVSTRKEAHEYLTVGFHPKSKIMITSRSKSGLQGLLPGVKFCMSIPKLNEEEAGMIFLRSAPPTKCFSLLTHEERRILELCIEKCALESSKDEYLDEVGNPDNSIVHGFPRYAYHPLALSALGDFFYRFSTNTEMLRWKDSLEENNELMRDVLQSPSIMSIIGLQFSALSSSEQLLFLDIALFRIPFGSYRWANTAVDEGFHFWVEWLSALHGATASVTERRLWDLKRSGMIDWRDVDDPYFTFEVHSLYKEFAVWYVAQHGMTGLKNVWGVFQPCGTNLGSDHSGSKSISDLVRLRVFRSTRSNIWSLSKKRWQELQNLVLLQLHYCTNVREVSLEGLDSLRHLELIGLSNLVEVTLMGSSGLQEDGGISESLQYVFLQDLGSLTHAPDFRSCTSLRLLKVRHCREVTNFEGMECPHLRALWLDGLAQHQLGKLTNFRSLHCLKALLLELRGDDVDMFDAFDVHVKPYILKQGRPVEGAVHQGPEDSDEFSANSDADHYADVFEARTVINMHLENHSEKRGLSILQQVLADVHQKKWDQPSDSYFSFVLWSFNEGDKEELRLWGSGGQNRVIEWRFKDPEEYDD